MSGKFGGGSAWSMARDIGEGYLSITERSYRGMLPGEMNQLAHEMDRYLRELRGAQSPRDETSVVQARNRKIQRLATALTILRSYRQRAKI